MSGGEQAGINWVQVIGASLAAMSSAVLLSTLGVAGTIVGAAVGSIIASVGGAFYSRGLAASKQQVATQAAALRRATQARSRGEGPDGTAVLDPVVDPVPDPVTDPAAAPDADDATDEAPDQAPDEAPDEPEDVLFHTEAGKPLPWKRIAAVAGALFLVVMLVITGFELVTGQPVSASLGGSDKDGGTSLFNDGSGKKSPSPSPSPSDGASESATPSDGSDETSSPSDEASPTGTPSLPTDTLSPTASDTSSPTDGATDAG